MLATAIGIVYLNVDTAGTSSAVEHKKTIAKLQQEVSIERAWREREDILNQEVV